MSAQHMGLQSFGHTTLATDRTNLLLFAMHRLEVVSYNILFLPFFETLGTFEITVGEKSHHVFPDHPFPVDFFKVAKI